ncbi:MAG: hydrogenase maturation nickel metallochaperone HypA [Candidatus Brocadiales bacterium]|nr:hydrogenase maturation nickel metallochaperone HypA [Candidatus Brocadiales bacterium]
MHEFHLVENIIENVITKAREGNHEKVAAINVVLGKGSHVADENLKFLIELRCKETVADGAQINVKLTEGNNVFVESIDVE